MATDCSYPAQTIEVILEGAHVSDQLGGNKDLEDQITRLRRQAKPVIKNHNAWLKTISLKQFPKDGHKKGIEEEIATQATLKQPSNNPLLQYLRCDTIARLGLHLHDHFSHKASSNGILAEKLKNKKEEQFTMKKEQSFIHDTIAAQEDSLSTKIKAIRIDTNKKSSRIKRSDEDFISIGSAEDERLIKRMNEKGVDSSKSEVIKEESKEEVQKESKEEESTRKRKLSTRKKMKSRKRRYIQNTSEEIVRYLESEEDCTMALELIRFVKRLLAELELKNGGFSTHLASLVKSWLVQDQTVLGKDYSNLLIADSLLKTIWFINAPCYGNEALASPKANELTIPEQTATGKGTSNPFMAGSLPKTTKPT
ncbi:hypothetical protein Tco_1313562 [Tanacetum coccineum]